MQGGKRSRRHDLSQDILLREYPDEIARSPYEPTMSAWPGEAMRRKMEAIADRKQHQLSICMNSSASMVRAIPITPRMTKK